MLFDDRYDETEDGDIGDGSASALQSTFKDVAAGIDVATKAVNLFSGQKSTATEFGGIPVQQPITNQGGKIEEQNQTVTSIIGKVPWWGWLAAGVAVIFGLGAFVFGRR